MLQLLNAVNIFGKHITDATNLTIIFLVVAQVLIALGAIILTTYLVLNAKRNGMAEELVVADMQVAQQPNVVYVPQPGLLYPPELPEVERTLVGISLDTGVVQREFEIGEEFDCVGLIVRADFNTDPMNVTYTDYEIMDWNTFEILDRECRIYGVTVIHPGNMNESGKKAVSVKFANQTALYTIEVVAVKETVEPVVMIEETKERVLQSITLDTDKVRKEYLVGDSISHDGLVVCANYNLEPLTEEVTDYTVIDPNMDKVGNPTVTVSYQNMTVGYKITVNPAPVEKIEVVEVVEETKERVLQSITLNTDNVQKEFVVGDAINHEGLTVTANYNVEPLTEQVDDFAVIAPDMSKVGNPTVVVSYLTMTVGYKITVKPAPVVEPKVVEPEAVKVVEEVRERVLQGISLNTDNVQREFTVGDEINCERLAVIANYSVEPLTEVVTDYEVIVPNMEKVGPATVVISYQDLMAAYSIHIKPAPEKVAEPVVEETLVAVAPMVVEEVKERTLQSISLNTDFVQKEYTVGDALNHNGLIVTANYNVEPLTEQVEDFTVIAPDMSKVGAPTVTVSYQNMTVGYKITVKPAPVVTEEEVVEEVVAEPIVEEVVEEVKERVLQSISINTDNAQKEYTVGDTLNHDGLVVIANYNVEPLTEEVTDFAVIAPDMSKVGNPTVVVSYLTMTVGYRISITPAPEVVEEPAPVVEETPAPVVVVEQVKERVLQSISINTDNVQKEYTVGDAINHKGIIVTANYNVEPLMQQVSDFTIIAPDMSKAGNPIVTVCYQDRMVGYEITVNPTKEEVVEEVVEEVAEEKIEAPVVAESVVEEKERVLQSISLNTDYVQKEFTVGDTLNHKGLIVTANYNVEPYTEQVTNYAVMYPNMDKVGTSTVNVSFQDLMVGYQITINEKAEEPAPEVVETPVVVEEKQRLLQTIVLNTDFVQKDFIVGDALNHKGLIVIANYNLEPFVDIVTDYTVIAPDMNKAGTSTVTVAFQDKMVGYEITINAKEEEPVVVEVPVVEVKERVLQSITLNTDFVQKEYTVGDVINHKGLIVTANYNVEPYTEQVSDYAVIDPNTSKAGTPRVVVSYQDRMVGYQITINEKVEEPAPVVVEIPAPVVEVKKRELQSITLNTDHVQKEYTAGDALNHKGLIVTANYNVEPFTEQVTDYTVIAPDMSKAGHPTVTVSYQDMTVGYQITVNPAKEKPVQPVVEVEPAPVIITKAPAPVIVEEESFDARLRYDKSFTARLIQSEDEVKYWYTDLKNMLLSYKSVHGRISWKHETFKYHKDVIAKLAYRGKTLCIFLPLDPAKYAEEYYTEDVSDLSVYAETPAMIRLKNLKRVKLAKDLLEKIMKKKGIPSVPHELVDYYIPYEGILELINKGLIKREVKTAEDEAIFERDKGIPKNEQDDTFTLEEVVPGVYVTKKD